MVYGLTKRQYQLETKPFSSGGEGDVYGIVGLKDKVIKVYHPDRISTELEEKLKVMVRRPPNSRVLSQVAWPLDLVYDSRGFFCGFVMPRLSINAELNDIYGYPPRTNITYQQKLIIAQNICAVISEIHNAGYVFGDFNPNNIGINTATGRVAFLDTDSYHITDGNKTYRCKVCLDGYVAPELIKKCEKYPTDAYANAPLPTFTKETDNFALAIHIFKLLMNGYTPFNGIKETQRASTASPGVGNQAIKRDQYCFKPGNKPMSAAVPPIDVLPTEVADLFTRAFMDGRIDPKLRPSAYEWYKALESYEQSLVKCKKNSTHMYRRGLKRCPWCDADEAYKIAIAPTQRPAPAQKTFAQPVQPVSSYTPPVTPPIYTPPANQSPYTPQSGGSSSASSKQQGGSTQGNGGYTGGRRKHKGWIIVLAAVGVFLLIKYCSGSSSKSSNNADNNGRYSSTTQTQFGSSDNGDAKYHEALYLSTLLHHSPIAVGYNRTIGIRSDYSAIATGLNDHGECNVNTWNEVVAVASGDHHTIGLKKDGTVVATGRNDQKQCSVDGWTNIIAISAGGNHSVGLRENGTVVATGDNRNGECNVGSWSDIIAIDAGDFHTVGLKKDGTVVAVGASIESDGQCNVQGWRNIVAVSAGYKHTIGVKKDGTVVAVGLNNYGQCNVSNWSHIIAVSAGGYHTVAQKDDGTLVATGRNSDGQCDVANWHDVIYFAAGDSHTVGLIENGTVNGTVVGTGSQDDGQLSFKNWRSMLVMY